MVTLYYKGFTFKQLVQARVRAQNPYGWSPYSLPNTEGALIRVVPSAIGTIFVDAFATDTN
jgi:hypothetical protein